MNRNQRWADFFESERRLFNYILANTKTHAEHDAPQYIQIDEHRAKPPKFVRGIYQANSKEISDKIANEIARIKELYRLAVGLKHFRNYPNRMAEFYKDVAQINLSSSSAYESVKVEPNKSLLLAKEPIDHTNIEKVIDLMENALKVLKKAKIEAQFNTNIIKGFAELSVNGEYIIERYKSDNIQARRFSGTQYRALVRYIGESKGTRVKYGLMIIDSESACNVYESIQQGSRPHQIADNYKQIELPELSELEYYYHLYDKNAPI